jgi:predicted O-methyltransferase YrrM
MNFIARLKGEALRWSLPLPFECRHQEYSTIACVDDDPCRPSEWLIDISLKAIEQARKMDLTWVSKRMPVGPYWPDIWPGEHYKLLAGLIVVLKPKRVIEIGTLAGWSALSIKGNLPLGSELITIDIIPWTEIKDTALIPSDFEDGGLRQVIGDLSDPAFFASFAETLSGCDLLFVDAPKNVTFETTLLQQLSTIRLPDKALVIFDDIRNWNMLKIWRNISRAKLDLTSFGHWTGTGIIDWNG